MQPEPRPVQLGTVLAAVQTAARRLRRWPTASLDRLCARRSAVRQVGTEKRPGSRTEKPQKGRSMMWWPDGNNGQTESVVAGGRMPLRGVCLRHRGWHVRASARVDAVRHSECGSRDRAESQRVPNGRQCCAIERAKRSA